QHIVINPAGIFSSTPIQVGGAPVPGTPAMPLAPGEVPVWVRDVLPGDQKHNLVVEHRSRCVLCEEAVKA
ncbi:hypothetical protein QN400_21510, partial [Pseudomonas sp. RTC3]|nr:hypothetical protein [Pseudomonas sp. RTC3]MEB0242998.1 hypothetical protein [Pseudomonas sp. 5C2]